MASTREKLIALSAALAVGGAGWGIAKATGNGGNGNEGPTPRPTVTGPVTPGPESPEPTVSPTVSPSPAVTPSPVVTPEVPVVSPVACAEVPSDLESLPRHSVNEAPLGQWFHPIYDTDRFQASGGFEGQWSWFNTLCLIQADGAQFLGFENNDASFVARVNQPTANVAFAVLTTGEFRDQFMQGGNFVHSLNVRTLPGTTVEIFDPRTGEVVGAQEVSRGGDLLIRLPDNGVVGIRFPINDPAGSFEARMWFGPDDRPDANINRFDARALSR